MPCRRPARRLRQPPGMFNLRTGARFGLPRRSSRDFISQTVEQPHSMADTTYWDERIETLPAVDLARLQRHRLNWQLRRCWDGSPFYRGRLEAVGLGPEAFADPDILARLPILTMSDLLAETAAYPPFGRVTVAPDAWWVETDETGPEPRRVWTDGDVSHRADIAARVLWAAGFARTRNAAVVYVFRDRERGDQHARAGVEAGLSRAVTQALASHDPTGMSDLMIWTDQMPAPGTPPDGSFQVFGLPGIAPTLAYECEARAGVHWAEDHYLVEAADLATGKPVPDGAAGNLVLTDLTREGSPLIRLALGYVGALDRTPCACGRTAARSHEIRPRA
jgi:phenylacetate-CoA ligase